MSIENLKSCWPECATNGGTGITKISPERIAIHEQAIAECNDPDLWLEDDPSGYKALHCKKRGKNLSHYWRIVDRLK